MTRDLDPLLLRDRLRATLVRYISTAVPVSTTRAPRLACAVMEALEDKALQLTKGPFLESLPDFRKKGSIRELVDSGVLASKWRRLEKTGFKRLLSRPLHAHQERAIRQAAKSRNFIVTTGTGSGKTECFLLPIVDHLLRDPDLAEPGVRAVIVYPLNALVNDQLYFRLAPLLLRQLKDPALRLVIIANGAHAHIYPKTPFHFFTFRGGLYVRIRRFSSASRDARLVIPRR